MPGKPTSDSVIYRQSAPWTLAVENDANGNPVYIGRANPATALLSVSAGTDPKAAGIWQIQKNAFQSITIGGTAQYFLTDISWANGTDAFASVWNNRASITYA